MIYVNFSYALEVTCNFEEVYTDSGVQQGIFLLKDQNLRYEYYDSDLYNYCKKWKFFLIHKIHKNNVQKIEENTEILDMFIKISSDFPDIKLL